jgi:hypothetical protein
MPIVQQGTVNTTALIVPDLYVQIVAPQNLVLNGVPTNLIGVVGSAVWGAVNQPVVVGSMTDYAQCFGAIQTRKYDMGTAVAIAVQQGAQAFSCVRVTDGTDIAAEITYQPTGTTASLVITALYTGSFGSQITVTLQPGTQVGSYRLVVAAPGVYPEVFDNITGSGAALWSALAAAVNSGAGVARGASQLVTMTAPGGAAAFTAGVVLPLYGGSDGAAGVTATTLVGQDVLPRRGMYALRGQGCSICVLADADSSAEWVTQAAFGLSEGVYMILAGPAGDMISDAVSVKATSGLDSYASKLMFGDWVWWQDQVNGVTRLVSPQGFVAGRLGNLSPEQSTLNKQIYGVVGTQKSSSPGSAQAATYAAADLAELFGAGIDVIANPQPGGSFWGVRGGYNSSSNASINGDNYTTMTNYLAATLNAGMGAYVGQLINNTLFQQIRATVMSFLQNLLTQGVLGQVGTTAPFSVVCDTSNNPLSRTSLGYVQCDVQVQYQAINQKFIVNLEGGQTVTIQTQTLPSGQV